MAANIQAISPQYSTGIKYSECREPLLVREFNDRPSFQHKIPPVIMPASKPAQKVHLGAELGNIALTAIAAPNPNESDKRRISIAHRPRPLQMMKYTLPIPL